MLCCYTGFGRKRPGHGGEEQCCTETLEALVGKNSFVFALNLLGFFRLHFLVQCTHFGIVRSDDDMSLNMTMSKVSRRLGLGHGPMRSRAGSGQWHRGTGGRSSEYSYQSPQRASVEINFVSVSAFRLDGSPARHASCHLAPLQTAEKGARWPWPRPVSGRQTICSSQPGMENFHLPARLVPPSLRTPQWGAGHFTVSR